ncbi:Arsenate reductase [Nitrincola lacisaponensis]|uniref:Arsenate reductase n=1 Tax=Nitrincola lacisaponensis TaxID=267850 RepID=A0A063Y2R8_9GAMM|nr:arsenate reductase ArsC [Nitrincola lacisaponensis]KDE38827.1 Arsenate reductase [Nitrincola lacisaponensis]
MNILFLCTGNSCRSIMAEAILNERTNVHQAFSAGSHPAQNVHPMALKTLESHHIATEGLFSKDWDSLPVVPDLVITLCSDAASTPCPVYLGNVMRSHWSMTDPSKINASAEGQQAAFEQAFTLLQRRIDYFLQHHPEHLSPPELDTLLDQCSSLN